MTVKTNYITFFLVLFVFTLTMFGASDNSCAQSPPVDPNEIPESCDPDYMDVLNIRAWLEGKRELETAQRIILKPDSVLEYSCFNNDLYEAAYSASRFSVGGLGFAVYPPEFDGGIGIPSSSLEGKLNLIVYQSLIQFLDSYTHTFLGGSIPTIPSTSCNPMNIVWFASKCTNFDPDWWVRFEDINATDIRLFPVPCGGAYDPNRIANINAALGASYPAPADPAANGGADVLDSHLPTIRGACGGGIDTGVNVTLLDGSVVDDAVCIQPKCYFTGTNCTL